MIRVASQPIGVPCLYDIFIDEETMTVDHYDESVTSEQLDHIITVLQKTIDTIFEMTFSPARYRIYDWAYLYNNFVCISNNKKYNLVSIQPKNTDFLVEQYCVPYDDFKNLLIAQNKENELAYLLLKGFLE